MPNNPTAQETLNNALRIFQDQLINLREQTTLATAAFHANHFSEARITSRKAINLYSKQKKLALNELVLAGYRADSNVPLDLGPVTTLQNETAQLHKALVELNKSAVKAERQAEEDFATTLPAEPVAAPVEGVAAKEISMPTEETVEATKATDTFQETIDILNQEMAKLRISEPQTQTLKGRLPLQPNAQKIEAIVAIISGVTQFKKTHDLHIKNFDDTQKVVMADLINDNHGEASISAMRAREACGDARNAWHRKLKTLLSNLKRTGTLFNNEQTSSDRLPGITILGLSLTQITQLDTPFNAILDKFCELEEYVSKQDFSAKQTQILAVTQTTSVTAAPEQLPILQPEEKDLVSSPETLEKAEADSNENAPLLSVVINEPVIVREPSKSHPEKIARPPFTEEELTTAANTLASAAILAAITEMEAERAEAMGVVLTSDQPTNNDGGPLDTPAIQLCVTQVLKEIHELDTTGQHPIEVAKAKESVKKLLETSTEPNLKTYQKEALNMQGHHCHKLRYLGLLLTALGAAIATALGVSLITVATISVVACAATLFATRRTEQSQSIKKNDEIIASNSALVS